MIKFVLYLCFCFALMMIFLACLNQGLKKHEINECFKWQKQAEEYRTLLFPDWAVNQCEYYNIQIKYKARATRVN